MLSNRPQYTYSGKIEEFETGYSSGEFTVETIDLKIVLDKNKFIELRDKINKVYEDVI